MGDTEQDDLVRMKDLLDEVSRKVDCETLSGWIDGIIHGDKDGTLFKSLVYKTDFAETVLKPMHKRVFVRKCAKTVAECVACGREPLDWMVRIVERHAPKLLENDDGRAAKNPE